MDNVFDLLQASSQFLGRPIERRSGVSRVAFVGDTHGASDVTRTVFDRFREQVDLFVFLGDYVDRGPDGIGNLAILASEHSQSPDKVLLLRGNHETPGPHEHYGFLKEVEEKVGAERYEEFLDYFSRLPYGALVNDYLCVHGGLAVGLSRTEQIDSFAMPVKDPSDPLPFQTLWNDPREMLEGFVPSIRGAGVYYFGADVALKFISENGLKGIVRAHEVADGFRWDLDGRIVTVFSSRYHDGRAGVLILEDGVMREEFV